MEQIDLVRHEQSVRAAIREAVGDVDTGGLELARLVKMVANLYDVIHDEHLRAADLSGPRLRLLIRLWAEEAHGTTQGTAPTHLSRSQNVSKNTISALLRGLEEQGLIERTLCTEDRRSFRIRLTDAGRSLVQATAPAYLAYLNQLSAGLAAPERQQLLGLLQKLYKSLTARAIVPALPDDLGNEPPVACADL